jgi:hypothetical protein
MQRRKEAELQRTPPALFLPGDFASLHLCIFASLRLCVRNAESQQGATT